MSVSDLNTPVVTGADSPCSSPLDLSPLVAHLKQTCLGWPAYGIPFCLALDRALVQLERGATYQRISPTRYRVTSAAPGDPGHAVSLGSCPCHAPGPWCWRRALVHLVAALPEGDQHGT